MPSILPSTRFIVSCQPPSLPALALSSIQPSISRASSSTGNPSEKNSITNSRMSPSLPGKSKLSQAQLDPDPEVDAWTLLEDGGGSVPSSGSNSVVNSGDNSNIRASYWLKGAMRMRRMDLLYVGAVDNDS